MEAGQDVAAGVDDNAAAQFAVSCAEATGVAPLAGAGRPLGEAPRAGAGLPLGEAPLAGDGLLVATWVTIRTSEGWTALYARSERGGAGVIEASAREMPEATSCWVRARGPGTNSP